MVYVLCPPRLCDLCRTLGQPNPPRQVDQECTLLYKADLLRDNGLIKGAFQMSWVHPAR